MENAQNFSIEESVSLLRVYASPTYQGLEGPYGPKGKKEIYKERKSYLSFTIFHLSFNRILKHKSCEFFLD